MPSFLEMSRDDPSAVQEGRRICLLKTCEDLASQCELGVKLVVRRAAIAAVCVFYFLATSGAQASSVVITGTPFGTDEVVAFPGYGTSLNRNNVVGFGASGISDPTKGTGWLAQGKTIASAVIANVSDYFVDWYFNGAESGDTIKFVSQSLSFSEKNENNRYNSGNDPGWWMVGTTQGSGKEQPIPFSLIDTNYGTSLSNGANNKPGSFIASLMFAYVEAVYNNKGALTGWKVTKSPTDWFAFGFDDPGSANNDHDDLVMIGHLRPTPIPGALPLLGTGLGGAYLVGIWRKRRFRRVRVAAC